jgi:3-carboxy-cis,cis-muconate cycloisomerase
MALSVFEDALLGPLFADPVAARAFDAAATLRHYNTFEVALTEACAAEGLVPRASAQKVIAVLGGFRPDLAQLAAGTATDGVPVPAYVRALKAQVGAEDAGAVHFGGTTQDLMDTARAMALADVNDVLKARIDALSAALTTLSGRYGEAPLMGRTRMQAALEITVGDRIGAWAAPFPAHAERLARLRPLVEALQLGGPVGTRAAWRGKGDKIAARMAKALDLSDPPAAWHTRRDHLGEYGAFLSLVTAACGKIGGDVVLMAQQGIGEVELPGGGSSAMPHKNNPVGAELLVTLARFNAAQVGALHQALVHEQERSGVSWALEWMVLPQMCAAAGRALDGATDLIHALKRVGTEK